MPALALHLAESQRHRELRVLAGRDRVATDLYDHLLQSCSVSDWACKLPWASAVAEFGRQDARSHRAAAGMMREAVGNAVWHAKAVELTVTISVDDDLVVEVVDNGIGNADLAAGRGLRDLQRRADEVTGSFSVGNGHDGGTSLTWTAPLP
jgi:signal transduction histidine kinase